MSEVNGSRLRCQGTRQDGTPCQSVVVGTRGFCYEHDPEVSAEERMAAKHRGGQASARRFKQGLSPEELGPLESASDAQRWLILVTTAVGEGRIAASQGTVMVAGVREWNKAEDLRVRGQVREQLDALKKKEGTL